MITTYDIRNDDITPKRAAVIAAKETETTVEYRGDGQVQIHFPRVRKNAAEYLIEHHGFLLTPTQPNTGVTVYNLNTEVENNV